VDTGATVTVAPVSFGLTRLRSRRWAIVAALSVTGTVSYGILYYVFAAFLVPIQADLGVTAAELAGAFSLALLISAEVLAAARPPRPTEE
jgi:hypothetical protein